MAKQETKENITDMIVAMTEQYTDLYFETFKAKSMDKQIWAALHVGFITGMKINGYDQKLLDDALDSAQEIIAKSLKESVKQK